MKNMKLTINSKVDAKKFVENFEEYAYEHEFDEERLQFTFPNDRLEGESGRTHMILRDGDFYMFNFGQGWRDQIEEPIRADVTDWVYDHRKGINKVLKGRMI